MRTGTPCPRSTRSPTSVNSADSRPVLPGPTTNDRPSSGGATMSEQVPQERRVVTAVPGPKSAELQARRLAAVSSAVTSTLPVFVARGGGGILEDVDGNRLIDFGAGIAVVNVGNAAPRVVAAVQEQVAAFTHTCFMVNP